MIIFSLQKGCSSPNHREHSRDDPGPGGQEAVFREDPGGGGQEVQGGPGEQHPGRQEGRAEVRGAGGEAEEVEGRLEEAARGRRRQGLPLDRLSALREPDSRAIPGDRLNKTRQTQCQ